MRKKLLSILALTILVTSTLVGCSGAPSTASTLTVLSITEGDVFVMKTGTDTWTEAQAGMSLEVGDTIKTGDGSGAQITFFDGSTIELEAGTQIEITSLDSSADTGTTTITLMQTIGTTLSRVTKLLDPASSYNVETPSGVAAVRGSMMIVRIIFDDPNYEDGTVLITCVEGDIWAIWQGVELQIPVGRTCIIRPGQPPELIPLNEPPQEGDDVTDEDTSNGQSEDLQPGGSATDSLQMPPPPTVVYSDPGVFERPATPTTDGGTPPPDGENTPPDDQNPPPGGGTPATIGVTLDQGNEGWIIIWDDDTEDWAIDVDTGEKVDGTNHQAYGSTHNINVAGGHDYYVWVKDGGVLYYVKNPENLPDGWSKFDLEGGGEKAGGSAYEDTSYTFHFTGSQESK